MTASMSMDIAHPAFKCVGRTKIESLNVEVQEFVYPKLGTKHIHIASDYDENVFLVALRTVPQDSTGVAHILEHTSLCGSKRFPVRDPFFMMTRRSLNTFMNAFTSSDWTAYPFASQNKKDFFNLLDVYLDAVFFANLNELDFAQEGHRLEFAEADNPESELVYKGVVYNEMKGAMSSPISQLWSNLTRHLFPTATYHHNSGGEPEHIPDLTYDELVSFYQQHYHPSNALFLTFGNLPAKEMQQEFEDKVLSNFDKATSVVEVGLEKRYFAPVRVQEHYPLSAGEETENKTHIAMGWLLSESANLEENLEAHLLTNVLLENSASPLMQALETTDLGHSPSGLCGLEDSFREMVFVCGIEGSDQKNTDSFESLVVSILEKVKEEGVAQEKVEAVLHQLELNQREISGDSYPYGLHLILAAMPPALQGENPAKVLDITPVIEKLRTRIQDPDYIKQLVDKFLLNNPHRITLTMPPCTELESRREQYVKDSLAAVHERLTQDEKQALVDQAEALQARQNEQDPEDILPKVGLQDVPEDLPIIEPVSIDSDLPIACFASGTNGLVYEQAIIPLPDLDQDELQLLPLLTFCLTEMGVGEASYLDMQDKQAAFTGGINSYWEIKGNVNDEQDCKGYFVLSGKALLRNHESLTQILRDTFNDVRFDELERLKELIAQLLSRREQSVTNNGHSLAMAAAASLLSPGARVSHHSSGLEGISWIKKLDKAVNDQTELKKVADSLVALHQKVISNPAQYLIVAEKASLEELVDSVSKIWGTECSDKSIGSQLKLDSTRSHQKVGWVTNSQVSFCAKAYATVPTDHADAAPLTVLGHYLRNGFLHRSIREQGGAYGSGAGQDSSNAAFRFYSYRDPRIEGTLDDFDASVKWLLEGEQIPEALEQAVLGVVSSIDKPRSPAGEAKTSYHSGLFGRTPEQRKRFRQRILAVTLEDLKRVAQTYLVNQPSSIAVVSGEGAVETFENLGFDVHRL